MRSLEWNSFLHISACLKQIVSMSSRNRAGGTENHAKVPYQGRATWRRRLDQTSTRGALVGTPRKCMIIFTAQRIWTPYANTCLCRAHIQRLLHMPSRIAALHEALCCRLSRLRPVISSRNSLHASSVLRCTFVRQCLDLTPCVLLITCLLLFVKYDT